MEIPIPVTILSSLSRLKIEYFYCKSIFKAVQLRTTGRRTSFIWIETKNPLVRIIEYVSFLY